MGTIWHGVAKGAAILLYLSLAAPTASAQVQAGLTASNLRYTLGDLRPNDGIVPGIQSSTSGRGGSAEVLVHDGHGMPVYEDRKRLSDPDPDAASVSWNDAVSASAQLALGTFPFWTSSAVLGVEVLPGLGQARSGSVSVNAFEQFRLSPYTSMTVSLDVDILLGITPGSELAQDAHAVASFAGSGEYFREGSMPQRFEENAYDDGHSSLPDAQRSGVLTLTFVNDTAAWGDAAFSFNFLAEAQLAPLSPVPEPDAQAMSGAGLAVLALAGFAARRRKKRGAAAPLPALQAQA